jgi:nitrate/TMAO reductase-like tetraheme cytochrome c subunit
MSRVVSAFSAGIVLLLISLSMSAIANTEAPVAPSKPVLSEEEIAAKRWVAIRICFDCHEMSEAIISQQPRRRQKKHRSAMKEQRSCLDCHTSDDVSCCHDRMFPKIDRWD